MMPWVKNSCGGLLNVDCVRESTTFVKEEHLTGQKHGNLRVDNMAQMEQPQGPNFMKSIAVPLVIGVCIIVLVYRQ
jgi:hypothetical protein